MNNYDWLEKRTPRSVDQLRLWPENPRLDPEENHISIEDYTADLIADNAEKDSFLELVASIASFGYIPADPIVVWKNESNDKYYVAEGNRRVLALKLLRTPEKAPKSIRGYIRKRADLIDRKAIEKIKVSVAPSLEDTEWYINQRHSSSSLQRPWSRLQQQRWIGDLYDKYAGDVEKVSSVTNLTRGQLEHTLRILKIRDFAVQPKILKQLKKDDQDKVKSHRIPMTILERWFINLEVKEKWGIDFDGENVKILSNMDSFLFAYASWLKLVIHRNEPDVHPKIDTRTITSNLNEILEALPKVKFDDNTESDALSETKPGEEEGKDKDSENGADDTDNGKPSKKPDNKNPDRNRLIPNSYKLTTSNHKLDALFREFKDLPILKYKNTTAAGLRIFLDLSVAEFITIENCENDLVKMYKMAYKEIVLRKRLEYIKQNKLNAKTAAYKIVDRLLNPNNEYSLDTLNNYIHGTETHHTNKRFLNGFWDFLTPLLEELIGMEAK